MTKQEHGTRLNQRVRLKTDGQDRLYDRACAGSEGWIRKQDHDSLGYPTVFIEWDKDHWTYNGEPDRWALDAHFEPVEKKMSQNPNPDPNQFAELFSKFMEWQQEQGQSSEPQEQDVDREYLEVLSAAFEAAKECDSFLLIGISKAGEQAGYPAFAPTILNYYKDTQTGLVLEAQLSRLASNAHHNAIVDAIKSTTDKERQ